MATRWIESGRAKRAMDLLIAVPAFVVLAPVSALVAVLVRWRLGSPILFRQERAGRGAVPIRVPKFRSMTDARDELGRLLPDEERLTTFGAVLRSTSLDELPQLWTVIRGDMSLVGPRPLPTSYVDRYSPDQRRRLEARPGITGWAQVRGRNATDWPVRLAHDVWYVDHASLRLDLRILAMTVVIALRREGVAADGHVTMREFMGES
jgi:sugar transferase EpsL